MRELLGFLIQAISVYIGDMVDSSFGNNMNVDVIVVMGSFTIVSWFGYVFAKAGAYIYRAWRNRVWTCVLVSMIASGLFGVFVYVFRNMISHIFILTELQYEMLNNVLAVYSFGLVAIGIGQMLDVYALLHNQIKELMISNTIYYICLVLFDIVVVVLKLDCEYLIAGTVLSWVIFDIILAGLTHIIRDNKDKIVLRDVWVCFTASIKVMCGKISTRIAIIYIRRTVSGLGTIPYALFTVANAVEEFCEGAIVGWSDYLIYALKKYKLEECIEKAKRLERRYGWAIAVAVICGMPIATLLLKGEMNFMQVICYTCIMIPGLCAFFFHCKYDSFLTLCNAFSKISITAIASASARVGLCMLTHYYFNDNLILFMCCWNADIIVRLVLNRAFSKQEKLRLRLQLA